MDLLTSGWRHYRMLADYAAASPWLAQMFARSHIVEFPFEVGGARENVDQMLPSEKWLPRSAKKLLPPVPEQRFGHFTLDFTDTRPPYPDLIMLGTPEGPADFIYLHSTSRGAKDFEAELGHFHQCHRDTLDVLVRLYAITRDKYEDRIPALRTLYHFGLSNTYAQVFHSLLDDAANRAAADDVAAFLAKDTDAISNLTAEIAEAIYARMLQAETQIPGIPRIPIPSRRNAVLLRELDDHCAWWGDTAIAFVAGMCLLNCKNIVEQPVESPPLNRAARRRGENLPRYRYHVLKVRPFGSRKQRDLVSDNGQLTPLHWVKGHFKSYSLERPLLGRFSGRFWFQPHLAGRDTRRIVAKSYKADMAVISASGR
jgi:hypothetical protein